MLRTLVLAGGVALLAAGTAAAGTNATASLSSSTAGAESVSLTIVLRDTVLQCGKLKARSLTVSLPHAMRVPRSIPAGAVRVGGRSVASVRMEGTTILLSLPPVVGVTCDSMVMGSVRIQVAPSAGLGNPVRSGTYAFTVEAKPRGQLWRGSLLVRR